MNARHLERIGEVVGRAINQSTDPLSADPLIQRCVSQVRGACWARPGGKCGIYGA